MSSSTIPNSFDDVTDFVVNRGNGITGLVDSGIQKVPERYILPPQQRFDLTKVVSQDSILIIDVSNWDDPEVIKSICEASGKWGFFQIINHGIPLQVLENITDAAHSFFGLPNEQRSKYYKGASPSETVFLATSFSPQAEVALEWRDYLSFQYIPGNDQASALWPPVCKDEVLEYMKKAEIVIKNLLQVLLQGLNVKDFDRDTQHTLMGSPRIYLNYYPKCPNPELTAGVGPHSDISTITVLLQDDIGGLYVRGIEDDTWIHVPPIKGALVINIGDVLQIISNDKYKSIEHRVVANKIKNRVSVPIFVNPAPDAVFGPLPESGEIPIYKQLVFSDYFNFYFSKPHDGKKTIDYARI
ncbi:hypothetical protein CISIN_1g018488mg [Citrus sinensis]|uniref:trans-4-coumaroyl-CoA 2'-hydroxylase n=1 Tax=Citrus sinensis TaxID=2711 RepID=A0A067FT96_CITSI|nr:hypothetical protein CISIN_1g018488mg [Citrus sinensis]KDO66422.1 hypothetical protein CISIN_1g018488mg [Citrus sinensis]